MVVETTILVHRLTNAQNVLNLESCKALMEFLQKRMYISAQENGSTTTQGPIKDPSHALCLFQESRKKSGWFDARYSPILKENMSHATFYKSCSARCGHGKLSKDLIHAFFLH